MKYLYLYYLLTFTRYKYFHMSQHMVENASGKASPVLKHPLQGWSLRPGVVYYVSDAK